MRLSDRRDDTVAAMDAFLSRTSPAPVIVGFSGGGDSLALLLETVEWARSAGRKVVAATVDHQLQPDSAVWAQRCAERCHRLGVQHAQLFWTGPKPTTGLSAAARGARHRLLARCARDLGARVILLGHTADDRAEADAMRAVGATTPSPRLWSPSPAWPEGRGVFLFRPLLGRRRAGLRAELERRGENWIEDPANADPASLRAQVRRSDLAVKDYVDPPALALASAMAASAPFGAIRLAGEVAPDVFARALVCAGGGRAAPRKVKITAAFATVRSGGKAVLAGAVAQAWNGDILISRDPGAWRRRGDPGLIDGVWDGRLELEAAQGARPATGLRRRLSRVDQAQLVSAPAPLRAMAPVVETTEGARLVNFRDCVWPRFLSACGAAPSEDAGDAIWMNGDSLANRSTIPTLGGQP